MLARVSSLCLSFLREAAVVVDALRSRGLPISAPTALRFVAYTYEVNPRVIQSAVAGTFDPRDGFYESFVDLEKAVTGTEVRWDAWRPATRLEQCLKRCVDMACPRAPQG